TKAGGGDLRLLGTSANTYTGKTTVAAGAFILNKSAGVTSVAGALDVQANMYEDSDDQIADTSPVSINGGVMGVGGNETIGPLVKNGAGTLSIDASTNPFSGPTNFNAGTLLVNGIMTDSAVTANGGILGGTGTTGSANIWGVLDPGDGVGTLHTGNVTLNGFA